MNNSDHAASSGWTPDCAAIAPLLALRETGMLDADEAMRVELHLAACAACQRETALDGALAGDLRRALLAPAGVGASALTQEDIQRAATRRDLDGEPLVSVTTPPTRSTRPAPPRRPGAYHWRGGLAAVAAALAIVLFAVYIFGTMPRIGGVALVRPVATLDPALAQRTVYIVADRLYALRASDASVRWTYPPTKTKDAANDASGIESLTLNGDTLYALATSRDASLQSHSALLALDARTGAVRWQETIPGEEFASLLLTGNLLIVSPYLVPHVFQTVGPNNQIVLAYSATTGRPQWSRKLPGWPLSKPTVAGGAMYVVTGAQLISLDVATGAIRWTTQIMPSASQRGEIPFVGSPSVELAAAGSHVFALARHDIQSRDSLSEEADLYEIAAADGALIGRYEFDNEVIPLGRTIVETSPAPMSQGNQLFAPVFGGLSAFTIGASPALQWRFSPHDALDGSVAMTGATYADGVVYVTSIFDVPDNNVTYSRSATYAVRASDGAQLWRSQIYSSGALTPVVGSGVVFTTSYGDLLALRAADGQRLWKFPASGVVGTVSAIQFG